MPASRIPGVLGVAPTASHGAPLKPNEDRRHAGSDTLPLDGEEALGDSASGDESHAPSRLISAKHVGVSRIIARSEHDTGRRPWLVAWHAFRAESLIVGFPRKAHQLFWRLRPHPSDSSGQRILGPEKSGIVPVARRSLKVIGRGVEAA